MSTVIRTELSEKNKYYIPKERYLELRHFVNQYNSWGEEIVSIDIYQHSDTVRERVTESRDSSFLEDIVLKRISLVDKTKLVDHAFRVTLFGEKPINDVFRFIFKLAVINGYPYDKTSLSNHISRTRYYELYRKFFYELDKIRD
jgi:hypothetical protein